MDASSSGDAAVGFAFLACYGIFFLIAFALFLLNIWMLIDAIQRQEYEYPGSTGSSKNLWIIILAVGLVLGFGGIAALVYFFMVFKKLKRGTVAPQQMAPQQYAPAPQGYVPPAPPAYQPPAPPMAPPMAPPAPPMAPPMAPPAPPMAPPMAPPEMPAPPMAPPEAPMPPSEPPAE